jgi:hypothetical protein
MTKSSLLRLIVRLAGVLIIYQLMFASVQWVTLHWFTDIRHVTWLPLLLLSFWLLVAFIFLRASASLITLVESEWGLDGRFVSNRSRGLEFVAIRMLGLYLMLLASFEIAHLIAFQIEFRDNLIRFGSIWVEVSKEPVATSAAAASKLLTGLWLIVGTRSVQSWMRRMRTARRNWKIE